MKLMLFRQILRMFANNTESNPRTCEVIIRIILKKALSSGTWSYYTTGLKNLSNNLQYQYTDIFPFTTPNGSAPTTLDAVPVGSTCVIEGCALSPSLKLRLEEMGLTNGAKVTVLKTAPLGDPMEIRVRGYSLCIRKETAKLFTVTTI